MKSGVKIAVADDHIIFTKSFVGLLGKIGYNNIVFEAENGKAVIENLKKSKLDLLFLDYDMPIMDGKAVLEKIRTKFPGVKVIILSAYYEDAFIVEFIKKGANGFLPKNCDVEMLTSTIRGVLEAGFYLDKKIAHLMPKIIEPETNTAERQNKNKFPLTKQETEVIRLLCQYLSNKEIAKRLGVSPKTIQTHRFNNKPLSIVLK